MFPQFFGGGAAGLWFAPIHNTTESTTTKVTKIKKNKTTVNIYLFSTVISFILISPCFSEPAVTVHLTQVHSSGDTAES